MEKQKEKKLAIFFHYFKQKGRGVGQTAKHHPQYGPALFRKLSFHVYIINLQEGIKMYILYESEIYLTKLIVRL